METTTAKPQGAYRDYARPGPRHRPRTLPAQSPHSFYAWHREGEYDYLTDATDRAMLPWVQKFNPYDLYSKSPDRPQLAALKPYYEDLLAKYLPATLKF